MLDAQSERTPVVILIPIVNEMLWWIGLFACVAFVVGALGKIGRDKVPTGKDEPPRD